MTRKKILFIISNMQTGGVSKSMASLLNVIDKERYDVSLMIASPTGAFMSLLPEGIRIITNPVWNALQQRLSGVGSLLRQGHLFLAIGHLLRLVTSCFSKPKAALLIARLMPPIDEEFDTIVDFNGQQQLYYMVNKLRAAKKITFFHSDYKKWPYYFSADKQYFARVHSIWTISQQCAQSLRELFPAQSHKVAIMENISSLRLINHMSNVPIDDMPLEDSVPAIVTIGHVCEHKGSHWALEAAKILKDRGIRYHWYFLGSNSDSRFLIMRDNLKLERDVTFLGIRVNPYPYIKNATIIAHTTQYEGKSIALDEAKLLCKPIVVTNFSTVHDQFKNRYNASICEMTPQSIADAIEELLSDSNLRSSYVKTLYVDRHDNADEINKLYSVIDA